MSLPRAALCLAAVCLLAAGAAVAAGPADDGSSQPRIVTQANTSGHLQPEAEGASARAYVHEDVDLAAAVAADAEMLRAEHESRAFEQALDADGDRTERLGTIREHLTRLQERTAALQAAHREARAAYLDGSISREELLHRLARIDTRATRLERLRNTMERRTVEISPQPGSALIAVQNLEADLETIGGPATRRLLDRFAGNLSAGTTYVAVHGSNGLVLATVTDGQLYRDALDEAERDPDGTDRFGEADEPEISVALRRSATLYPWAFENGDAAEPLRGYGDTAVYRITADHSHGRLSAYLDGATENVFRELQQTRVGAVPVTERLSATDDGLRLRVNTTHETGPLAVSVQRANTGTPVDARITIDGTFVGATGDDGRRWLVQPPGSATVRVTADDGATVSLTL